MGIPYIAVPAKWVGVVIFGILCFDMCEKTDAAFHCSNDTTNCSCVTVTGPQSTIVLSSTTISLTCIVTNTSGEEVQWVKDGVPLGLDPAIPGESRYSMDDNYSLIITDVQLSDQSTYYCQVADCLIQSTEAELTVYVLPSVPVVAYASDDGTVDVVASDITSLECSTSHAKPSATIGWFNISDGNQLPSTEVETQDSNGQTISYTSTFTFTPSIDNNDFKLYCAVGGPAVLLTGQASLDTIITLNVISKPSTFSLTGATNGRTLTIDSGSSATVTCNATSTESNSILTWERNGVDQPSTSYSQESLDDGNVQLSSNLYIFGVGENDGAVYQCTVTIPGQTRSYQESLGFTVNIYEFPLGWVIGGSILGLLLIIALIILIICCMRRKGKETTLSDSMPDPSPRQVITENPATNIEAEDEPVVERVHATTEGALQQAAELDSSSDTDTGYTTVERETDDDEDSIKLPDGDVFSLSSSMMRSDRGSPVPNGGDVEDNDEESTSEEETNYIPPPRARSIQTFYV